MDAHAQLMTDYDVSRMREGIDPLELTAEYRYDIGEVCTFIVDRNFPWLRKAPDHYSIRKRFSRWFKKLIATFE
ncbi:hypothetical protein [Chamaesiphon sp.]|uniref:hypothetical protein n=1 Tax=Chamaesiphon sp. TaxID=2814140 RepID=UPI0035943B5C